MPLSAARETGQMQETRFLEVVFPDRANHYGPLFGGNALCLMGKAAFIAATRHARCKVVMATSDKIEFHEPVAVGELIELVARIVRDGVTSMTVFVEVIRENPVSGVRRSAAQGRFEMVAVDDDGRPVSFVNKTGRKTPASDAIQASRETLS